MKETRTFAVVLFSLLFLTIAFTILIEFPSSKKNGVEFCSKGNQWVPCN